MRICVASIVFLGALALGSTAVSAPQPAVSYDFALSAPAGHFETWSATNLGDVNTFQTRLRFEGFEHDPQWGPGIKIALLKGNQMAMLSFSGRQGIPMGIALDTTRSQQVQNHEEFKFRPDSSDVVEVKIQWSMDGSVTASVRAPNGGPA